MRWCSSVLTFQAFLPTNKDKDREEQMTDAEEGPNKWNPGKVKAGHSYEITDQTNRCVPDESTGESTGDLIPSIC